MLTEPYFCGGTRGGRLIQEVNSLVAFKTVWEGREQKKPRERERTREEKVLSCGALDTTARRSSGGAKFTWFLGGLFPVPPSRRRKEKKREIGERERDRERPVTATFLSPESELWDWERGSKGGRTQPLPPLVLVLY